MRESCVVPIWTGFIIGRHNKNPSWWTMMNHARALMGRWPSRNFRRFLGWEVTWLFRVRTGKAPLWWVAGWVVKNRDQLESHYNELSTMRVHLGSGSWKALEYSGSGSEGGDGAGEDEKSQRWLVSSLASVHIQEWGRGSRVCPGHACTVTSGQQSSNDLELWMGLGDDGGIRAKIQTQSDQHSGDGWRQNRGWNEPGRKCLAKSKGGWNFNG